jgi:hypothetical protein
MSISKESVRELCESASHAVETWESQDTPVVRWRGNARKAISGALIEAWYGMIDAVSTMEVEDDAKSTVLAIDEFEVVLEEWATKCDVSPDEADPKGSHDLWVAWRSIVESLAVVKRKKPEPLKQLIAEKLSDRQIALAYGWKDETGEPDIQKVREEKESPGKHLDLDTWVHPAEVKEKAEIEAKWASRPEHLAGKKLTESQKKDAPESLDDLIRQRVPSAQIARMKNIELEAIQKRASELKIPLDGQFVPSMSPADQMSDVREADAQREAEIERLMQDEGDSPLSLPDQVAMLHAEGNDVDAIVDALKPDFPKLTKAKVAKIVEKHTDELSQL